VFHEVATRFLGFCQVERNKEALTLSLSGIFPGEYYKKKDRLTRLSLAK
jgi:hypothetical protein